MGFDFFMMGLIGFLFGFGLCDLDAVEEVIFDMVLVFNWIFVM